jgi:hypothetical protein
MTSVAGSCNRAAGAQRFLALTDPGPKLKPAGNNGTINIDQVVSAQQAALAAWPVDHSADIDDRCSLAECLAALGRSDEALALTGGLCTVSRAADWLREGQQRQRNASALHPYTIFLQADSIDSDEAGQYSAPMGLPADQPVLVQGAACTPSQAIERVERVKRRLPERPGAHERRALSP